MLQNSVILTTAFAYVGILFAIAYFADKRADQGRSLISNPYVYTLSIAVYCTAWTFFGSVGRAASTGVGFLPIYLGPTLMAVVWWLVLRKIVRIVKTQRITSIADFIGSRYGKSALLTGLVTIIAVVGILPYISLQLKAVSTSYFIVQHYPDLVMPEQTTELAIWKDTALYVALLLAAFTILFGTRQIDVTERHEGMVAAIAFESLFKLVAFLAVGAFVTFGVFDGPGDIYTRVAAVPQLSELLTMEALPGGYAAWFSLTVISMFAIMFLPRQFQVMVVENVDEAHIRKASWLFPLYMLVINLFVLPLAFGGLLLFPDSAVDPDTFVLTIPMAQRQEALALLVFLGGLSAATGMVIVATIALATMVSNELVMPALLRNRFFGIGEQQDLTRLVLGIRRGTIVVILVLAYLYFRLIGESYALVTIGLVSFAAAAQFAPAILLGIYWTGATRRGALAGLTIGFVIWSYTLLLPALAKSGWLPASFVEQGLFGWSLLKPYALFGLEGLDPITHAAFWSLPANTLLLVAVSLFSRPGALEALQARTFVNIFESDQRRVNVWRGTVSVADLQALVARFIGEHQAQRSFARYARQQGIDFELLKGGEPHMHLVSYAERLLAGVIGAASARVMISTLFKGQTLDIGDVMDILDETSQVMEYSHRLEIKTRELEAVGKELRAANERLQELDRMKDDFVSTVSHELRTPLTSIRAFSEILLSEPEMDSEQRQRFLQIVINESERLTRLTNDVLDLAKIESGRMDWKMQPAVVQQIVEDASSSVFQIYQERGIKLHLDLPAKPAVANVDRDRILQVIINLLSNAVKFCEQDQGRVTISLSREQNGLRLCVADNGPGIEQKHQATLFDKFQQVSDQQQGKPKGSGLGLAICKLIVEHHGGQIWLDSAPGKGSRFYFTLQ